MESNIYIEQLNSAGMVSIAAFAISLQNIWRNIIYYTQRFDFLRILHTGCQLNNQLSYCNIITIIGYTLVSWKEL